MFLSNIFISTAFAQAGTARAETEGGLSEFFSDLVRMAPLWFAAIVVVIASFLVAKFVQKIVGYRVAKKRQHDVSREYIILIERATWAGVVLLGFIIAFGIVGINIATLIGFLGLGIGFALKDLLANFIAGVVILTQKKFHIGNVVKINGIVGKIIEIETRTTQIQAFDGTMHIIPNAELLTSVIQNYSTNSFRRIVFQVGVHYNTPLEETVALTMKSVTEHPKIVPDPKTAVLVTAFGDSAITLEVRFWVESNAPWPKIQSEVMQKLKRDYDSAGITIPFPMRTLTLDSYDKNILQAAHVAYEEPKFAFGGAEEVKTEAPAVQNTMPSAVPAQDGKTE